MATTERFWDKHADGYAKSPIKDMESYERCLEQTRARLGPNDTVLELGCGTGTTALRLAPSVERYVATDVSGRMIEIGRQKAEADPVPSLRFQQAELFDEKLEPGQFDAVLAFNLIHLIEDGPAAMRRIHALLRPGGVFVSKTVCLGEQTKLWKIVIGAARLVGAAPFVHCMTIAELEGLITANGFRVDETGTFPLKPPSRFVVARRE